MENDWYKDRNRWVTYFFKFINWIDLVRIIASQNLGFGWLNPCHLQKRNEIKQKKLCSERNGISFIHCSLDQPSIHCYPISGILGKGVEFLHQGLVSQLGMGVGDAAQAWGTVCAQCTGPVGRLPRSDSHCDSSLGIQFWEAQGF